MARVNGTAQRGLPVDLEGLGEADMETDSDEEQWRRRRSQDDGGEDDEGGPRYDISSRGRSRKRQKVIRTGKSPREPHKHTVFTTDDDEDEGAVSDVSPVDRRWPDGDQENESKLRRQRYWLSKGNGKRGGSDDYDDYDDM